MRELEREGEEAYEFIFGESDAITQDFYTNRATTSMDMNNINSYGSIPHPSTSNIYGHYYSPSPSPSPSPLPLPSPLLLPLPLRGVRRSRTSLWRDILIIFITWLFSFFSPSRFRSPSPSPSPPPFISERIQEQRSSHDIRVNRERRGGNLSGGLSESQFNQLTTILFQPSMEDHKCMICQSDYEMGDELILLPCTHKYHQHCIRPWLQTTKLCCVCKMEVNV